MSRVLFSVEKSLRKTNNQIGKYRRNKISFCKLLHFLASREELFTFYVLCEKNVREGNLISLEKSVRDGLGKYKKNHILKFYQLYCRYKKDRKIDRHGLKKLKPLNLRLFKKENQYLMSFGFIYFQKLILDGKFHEMEGNFDAALKVYRNVKKEITEADLEAFPSHAVCRMQEFLLQHPKFLEKRGDLKGAFEVYRSLLKKDIDPEIRCTIYRRIGFLLMNFGNTISPTYTQLENKFCFRNSVEEAYFSLFLSEESVIRREDFASLGSIIRPIYNDYCVLFASEHLFAPIIKILQRPVGRDHRGSIHWERMALTLISLGDYDTAHDILKEFLLCKQGGSVLSSMYVASPHMSLQLAKVYCLRYKTKRPNFTKAEKIVKIIYEEIVKKKQKGGCMFESRCLHLLGYINFRKSQLIHELEEKQYFQKKAIEEYVRAHDLDSGNGTYLFNLGYLYASVRDINTSFAYAKRALREGHGDVDLDTWILIALLFSSRGEMDKACEVLDSAAKRFFYHVGEGEERKGVL